MELTIERNYEFTPEWNGNKKDANPIVFEMRRLSTGERDRFMAYTFGAGDDLTRPAGWGCERHRRAHVACIGRQQVCWISKLVRFIKEPFD